MSPEPTTTAVGNTRTDQPDLVMSARGLDLSFGTTHALRGIDLDIAAGQSLAVTGPSGSGKSTLMHVLAGVLVPDAGSVLYDGRDIAALGESERSRLRLTAFGFVFQFGQLLPDLSALDNVTIPLLLAKVPRASALKRALLSATRAVGTALVVVTHDARTAAYCDREVIVRDGRLSGAPGTLGDPGTSPAGAGGRHLADGRHLAGGRRP